MHCYHMLTWMEKGNVSWRKPQAPAGNLETPVTTPAPKVAGGASVTKPAEQDITTPAAAILTADGKGVNRQAMQKAYKPGQQITLPNGSIKTWNGMTLQ